MSKRRFDLSVDLVASQLERLGVLEGGVLLVHSSFSTTGPIAGGPSGLIAALTAALGLDGTLVMPSWTGDDDSPFSPLTTPPAAELGILPGTFWRFPGVRLSAHLFAFAALGPEAEAITADLLILPPHQLASALGRVLERDGQIVLLGVGQDANTMIHLAEILGGAPYRRRKHCTVMSDGLPQRIDYCENDHCCQRFALADEWLRACGALREGPVGHGHARLMRASDLVTAVRAQLEADPLIFLHAPRAGCYECDDARASLPG